ncbi:MAG: hypothetical protein L6Q97_16070, partial [Thermoanaerobaculia bacterium]|nr:hypothetical protein [Thermoanaerobaculia bacterium]
MFFANGVIFGARKSLETAERLPLWDRVLSKVWVGSIVYFLLAQLPWLHFLGDWYGELIYLILLATVYQLRDYNPARLYSIALLPYAGIYVFNKLVHFVAPTFYAHYEGY